MKRPFQVLTSFVLIALIGLALSRFFSENVDLIQLEFMGFRTKSISKGALSVIIFFLGVGLTFIFTVTAVIAKSMESGRLRRENRSLQKLLEEKARDHSSSSKT